MKTRKELLGSLISKGIVVTNPLYENEHLEELNDQVAEMLDSYCEEEEEEDEEVEEVEEIPVKDQELIGKVVDDTEVVHLLYPGEEHYPQLMEWAERIKDEYEGVELKYFEDQDAFVFYSGDEDEALAIAEKMIEDIEAEEDEEEIEL